MKKPDSVAALTELGRQRLSPSFFMRDMLHSEIASFHGLPNIPNDPDLALEVGRRLCCELLEPLQDQWGRIAIRSAYRSPEVNALGNKMQSAGKKGYNCANNSKNAAHHIWDVRDDDGLMGATACIVVPRFWDQDQSEGAWQTIAHWIDANLPYSELEFFPTFWAFNISWHERPKRVIYSYAHPKGRLKIGTRAE